MRLLKALFLVVALAGIDLVVPHASGTIAGTNAQANRAPVAHAQARAVLEGAATPIALAASDPDGDALTFGIVAGPAHGTLSGTAPNVVYTPDQGYNGPDSFTFTAHDPETGGNIAAIDLTVGPALWRSTGLYGGAVELVTTDPTLPGVVYAGTTSGLFKSTDGGATWVASGTGLPHSGIFAMAIDPAATSTLYASAPGGLYKSVNGGAVWSLALSLPPVEQVRSIAIDPATPSTVYLAASGVLSPGPLYKSADGGATWTSSGSSGIASPVGFAIDPLTPSTLYVAGSNGVAKSTNAGDRWTLVNDGLTNTNVLGLAVDPAAPSTLFVSTNTGVFKSTNGGASWDATSAPLGGRLAMDPSSPLTLYLGTLSSGVYKTADGGTTWQPSNAASKSASQSSGMSVCPIRAMILRGARLGRRRAAVRRDRVRSGRM